MQQTRNCDDSFHCNECERDNYRSSKTWLYIFSYFRLVIDVLFLYFRLFAAFIVAPFARGLCTQLRMRKIRGTMNPTRLTSLLTMHSCLPPSKLFIRLVLIPFVAWPFVRYQHSVSPPSLPHENDAFLLLFPSYEVSNV